MSFWQGPWGLLAALLIVCSVCAPRASAGAGSGAYMEQVKIPMNLTSLPELHRSQGWLNDTGPLGKLLTKVRNKIAAALGKPGTLVPDNTTDAQNITLVVSPQLGPPDSLTSLLLPFTSTSCAAFEPPSPPPIPAPPLPPGMCPTDNYITGGGACSAANASCCQPQSPSRVNSEFPVICRPDTCTGVQQCLLNSAYSCPDGECQCSSDSIGGLAIRPSCFCSTSNLTCVPTDRQPSTGDLLIIFEVDKERLCLDSASNIRFLKPASKNVESAIRSPLNNTYVQVAKLDTGSILAVGFDQSYGSVRYSSPENQTSQLYSNLTWTITGAPAVTREHYDLTPLPGGRAAIIGGYNSNILAPLKDVEHRNF
ncbi:g2152 [Coccomyxa viridis]|uniref:G2152 protein n=1 Tax=Coccomyxa viridis TaxID=1274662 RepID=A0ABP1FRN7_9CHLO